MYTNIVLLYNILTHAHTHTYTHAERERESARARERERERHTHTHIKKRLCPVWTFDACHAQLLHKASYTIS